MNYKHKLSIISLGIGGLFSLLAISTNAQTIQHNEKIAAGIYEIIYNPTGHELYVATVGTRQNPGGFIFVLDAETLTKKDSIDVKFAPAFGLGFNRKTQMLYTSNTVSNSVHVVDVTKRELVITIYPEMENSHTREIVVDEDKNIIYVTDVGRPGSVWIIDGETNTLETIVGDLGTSTTAHALNKEKNVMYFTNMGGHDISILDLETQEIIQVFPAHGERPTNVQYDTETDRLFVTNQTTADLTVLNATTGELIKKIPTGEGSLGVRFDPDRNRIFVANRGSGTVNIIDSDSYEILATLETGTHPNTVVIDPATGAAYVTNKALGRARGSTEPPAPDPNGDTVTKIVFE